jgi:hypothetical protein
MILLISFVFAEYSYEKHFNKCLFIFGEIVLGKGNLIKKSNKDTIENVNKLHMPSTTICETRSKKKEGCVIKYFNFDIFRYPPTTRGIKKIEILAAGKRCCKYFNFAMSNDKPQATPIFTSE